MTEHILQMEAQSERIRPRRLQAEPIAEAMFVVLFIGFQVLAWTWLVQIKQGGLQWIIASIFGWIFADLCSGVVHFLADNFGSSKTPFFGRTVISTFREHHVFPDKILEHGFLERNGWNCAGACSLTLLSLLFVHMNAAFLATALLVAAFFLGCTNQIHAWAHSRAKSGGIRFLQYTGLILSPDLHAKHHHPFEDAHDRSALRHPSTWSNFCRGHYCITSGFLDRVLSPKSSSYTDR